MARGLSRFAARVVIALVAALVIVPLLWTLLSGFKNRVDIVTPTPMLFFTPTLDNFAYVLGRQSVRTAQIKMSSAPKGMGTVLLVEDEAALRVLAAESLKRLGYEVLSAKDGVEALIVVEEHGDKIDVVVTDVVMPRMGGPELVEKLRQKKDGFGVIFMSGYTETAALETAMIAPDACLLNKPFASEILAQKIRDVLDAAAKKASQPSQRRTKAAHV